MEGGSLMAEEEPGTSREAPEGAEAPSSRLRSLAEEAFLLGVGAASLTFERVENVIEDFVSHGRLSREDGKVLAERILAKSREEAADAATRVDKGLRGTFRDFGLVTQHDLNDIDFRLRQIEHRLTLIEARLDQCTDDQDC